MITSLAVLCAASAVNAEAPAIDTLFPAGGQIGQTVSVEVKGKAGTGPMQFWSSDAKVSLSAVEKDGKLEDGKLNVTIDPTSEPGFAWIRIYNTDGASKLLPFYKGHLTELAENEPNEAVDQAQPTEQLPVVMNGLLQKGGDVDTYSVALKAGEQLVAAVSALRGIGSRMDGILQILSPDGFVILQNDDERGFDPHLTFTPATDGIYFVRLFGFPADPNSSIAFAGNSSWAYRLTLTTGPYADSVQPLALAADSSKELIIRGWNIRQDAASIPVSWADGRPVFPTDIPPTAIPLQSLPVVSGQSLTESAAASTQPLTPPCFITGVIENPGEVDSYRIAAAKGATLRFRVRALSLGGALDPVLKVVRPDGKELKTVDDISRDNRDVNDVLKMPVEGEYTATVTDRFDSGGLRYFYQLSAEVEGPTVELTVTESHFTLEPDKALELPQTGNLRGAHAKELPITAEDLPEGVTVEPVVVPAKGDTKKPATLKITTDGKAPFNGPIRIVGRTSGDSPLVAMATAETIEGLPATTSLWLTVTVKK